MPKYGLRYPYAMTNYGLELRARAVKVDRADKRNKQNSELLRITGSCWQHEGELWRYLFLIRLSPPRDTNPRVLVLRRAYEPLQLSDGPASSKSDAITYNRLSAGDLANSFFLDKKTEPERTFYITLDCHY